MNTEDIGKPSNGTDSPQPVSPPIRKNPFSDLTFRSSRAHDTGAEPIESGRTGNTPCGWHAVAAVAIVVAAVLWIWIFVAPMHPYNHPLRLLTITYLVVAVATATMVFIDADRRGAPGLGQPFAWFAGVVLILPVALPAYFVRQYGSTHLKLQRLAVVCTVIYIVSISTCWLRVRQSYREFWPDEYTSQLSPKSIASGKARLGLRANHGQRPIQYPLFPQARYDVFNNATFMRYDTGDDPNDPGYPGWKMGKLVYFEHRRMVDLSLECDWDDCDPDNWLVAYELAGEWSLHSVGPSGHFQTPRWLDVTVVACFAPGCGQGIYRQDIWPYEERSMFRDYDPTNGTISAGCIWRTQKNPALLGTHIRFYDESSTATA